MSAEGTELTDETNEPDTKVTPQKRPARRIARIVFVSTCVGCLIYVLWMSFAPPPKFPISEETTRFVEPLTREGGVDFEAAWLKANGFLKRSRKPTEWDKLLIEEHGGIGYRSPRHLVYDEAVSSEEDWKERDNRDVLRINHPFSKEEDPEYSAVIEQNHTWYQAALDAEPRIPIRPGASFSFQEFAIADRFNLRAMSQIGNGDQLGAIESIRFISRLAERDREKQKVETLLHAVVADSLCFNLARQAMLHFEEPSPELLACVEDVTAPIRLHEDFATAIDGFERLAELEEIADPEFMEPDESSAFDPEDIKLNWFRHRMDWHRYARLHHEWFDGLSEGFRISDSKKRQNALSIFRKEFAAEHPAQEVDVDRWIHVLTGDITSLFVERLVSSAGFELEGVIDKDTNRRRLTRTVAAIAVFRNHHEGFPQTLEELAKSLPRKRHGILLQVGTNRRWKYQRTTDGFELSQPQATESPVDFTWPVPRDVPYPEVTGGTPVNQK